MAGDQCGANIRPNRDGLALRKRAPGMGTQVFCNVGLVSDNDKTVGVRRPKCLRWVLTALLLTAISTTIQCPLNSSLHCEGLLSEHTHIGSDPPFLINKESSSCAPQRPINGL